MHHGRSIMTAKRALEAWLMVELFELGFLAEKEREVLQLILSLASELALGA